MSTIHMDDLRQYLLSTLQDLRNRENPMEPERARAIAQVASVAVETVRVEVDFARTTHQHNIPFLQSKNTSLTKTGVLQQLPGTTTHRLRC